MNPRSKLQSATNTSSLSRLDKNRTNLVSPGRAINDKAVSPGQQGIEQSLANTKALLQKNQPSSTQQKGKNPSLSMAKGVTAQISLQDTKKQPGFLSANDLLPNSSETTPLPQLDISGIVPTEFKTDGQGQFMVNSQKIQPLASQGIGNTYNASAQQPIKKVSIQQGPSMVSSLSQNNLQKSPSRVYQNTAAAGTTLRKAESINVGNQINNNLIQSVNFGTVPSATQNMMLTSYNGNSTTQFTSNTNADTGNISSDNKNAAATNTALENSINFEVLKQFDQKQKSSNIKTFIRVRPLNKMEIEFNENGCGNENLRYPDTKTIQVLPEKTPFTLDKIYPPGTQQEAIYEDVGKEMVNDVMQGYNGTIFAYGATGTGKTFTMFGDVGDATNKGIIPRVSNQIFSHIASVDQDIEFTITCSMLEIYKEQLFDLLKVDRVGLKIKENPQKGGIYVQGLTAISVDCQEEIIDSINLGYQSKQTRETRMNEYSSRSHTIFTINVTQRYPNGQEKTGKLNLVDLAGCEKVGKSGAVGETLEEAKKINLSLSCLGNVIHALTSNQEHIPYRDSKLTRILQESLGGNYKTSLIASLSPHSSQHEEQLSTLRFAARAKTIKNQVKMNVKLSLDQMRKLIEQLKTELEKAQSTNTRFRTIIKKLREELKASQMVIMQPSKDGKVTEQQQAMQNTVKAIEDMLNISDLDIDESGAKTDPNAKSNTSKVSYDDSELDESTGNNNPNNLNNLNNNSSNSYNNTNQNFYQNDPASADYNKGPTSQFSGKRGGYQHRTLSNQNQLSGDPANQKGSNLDFKAAYYEKVSECRNLDKELMDLKRQLLETERKVADSREEKHKLEYNHTQQITKNDYNKFEIEILQKQVQSLVDSICKSENTIGSLMKEKQEISQKKIDDFLKEKLNFSEIHFSEYFKKSINFNYDNLVQKWSDVQKNMKTIGLDDQELFKSQAEFQVLDNDRNLQVRQSNTNFLSTGKDKPDDMIRGSFIGNLDFNQVSNPYDVLEEIVEFPGQLEKYSQQHPISRDLTIILLKKQLFNSHIINQHLARTINALEWKQIIEYGKAKMKSVLNKIQTKHINNLESVINEASQNYRTLRNRIEQVELETQFVKEKIDSHQDNVPKKSKIIKDSESIRSLLMKPSNEGIRQSLRGSYIGFQLDLDKQSDSPIMKELKETDELIQKELLPLTYDRAIEELKLRNALVRKSYQEAKGGLFNGVSQDFVEQVLKEKERLEGKITILSNELKMESSKSEHYADAYKAEKQNFTMQKEQTKELELFLVNKMKEDSEQIERSQKKISDSHEKEIMKYQQSFQRLSDCFSEYVRSSIARLSELRKQGDHVAQSQVEEMFKDMISVKEQYNKLFNPESGSQGIGNGNESPSMTPQGYKFNPNSQIFRSFELGGEAHTPSSTSSKSRVGQINPSNLILNQPNILVNQPNLVPPKDEVKETAVDSINRAPLSNPSTFSPFTAENSNSSNYTNYPGSIVTSKPIQTTQIPPYVPSTTLQSNPSKSSLKPNPSNLLFTPANAGIGAVPASNAYTNASNATALSGKPKLSTLPSTSLHQPTFQSKSSKTPGQGMFSQRKY